MGGLFILAACNSSIDENNLQINRGSLLSTAAPEVQSMVIPWGSQGRSVGLNPPGSERRATGVSAVALGPRTEVYLLDPLNRRVLQVQGHELRPAAPARRTDEDLAVGPTGTLAIFSPLNASVRLFDRGALSGEVAVPRVLRQIRSIALGPSRQVLIHNAYQETLTLGPATLPQTLETILHSRREGAAYLPDGSGVAAWLSPQGIPELLVLGPDQKTPPIARFSLGEKALAARVIGASGFAVCLRLERAAPGEEHTILRRAICLDTRSGRHLLDEELSRPGIYLPRRELDLGGSPPRLAFIRPEQAGLRLTTWPLATVTDGRDR